MKKKKAEPVPIEEPDERVRRSKETVLATTYKLLSEVGLSGVSIDAVAKRSGVAKTTIYRHWPSRSELLLDACSKLGSKLEDPNTGSFKGDVTAIVTSMAHRLQTPMGTVLPSIIDAGERDKKVAKLQTGIHAGFLTPLYTIIERAKEKGEVPNKLDASYLVSRIIGPLFYQRFFSRLPLDKPFITSVIESVLK